MAQSKIENARYVYISTTLSDAEAAKFLAWIEEQNPKPTKSEALRNFLLTGIGASTTR
jgi:hypothetical protein